jgi:hypothetical protein
LFTYSQLKEIYDGRRKSNRYCRLQGYCNCEVRQDCDGNMDVYFHGNLIAEFTPDNVVSLSSSGWFDSPTTRSRIWQITGVRIHSDRKYEDRIRVNGLPYSDALRFRHGRCINPEVAVDTWRTLDRKVVAKVVKKLKPLRSLMHSMDKLNAFDESVADSMIDATVVPDEEWAEPTAYLASRFYNYWRKRYGYNSKNVSIVDQGFTDLRNALYDDMNAHIKHEVRHGHDQRQAA